MILSKETINDLLEDYCNLTKKQIIEVAECGDFIGGDIDGLRNSLDELNYYVEIS